MPLRAAAASPGATQMIWYVDGEPFAVAPPGETVYWPLTPGPHRLQLRLYSGAELSRPTRIVVE